MRNPYFITLFALFIMLIVSLAIGSVFIPPAELWRLMNGTSDNETFRTILWNIRLPRTALIALIGAALIVYQSTVNRRWPFLLAVGLYIGVSALGSLYGFVLQRFYVSPNEQVREMPFIAHST